MATKTDPLKNKVQALPLDPGVYRFLDASGKVIYVGKAKSLRRRVTSYFTGSASQSPKVRVMVRRIADIEHIVTSSEDDALLLENNLIKEIQPRYNILLRDDKTYPWIVIRNEPFPRVQSTRRIEHDGSQYFGPYASQGMQHYLLELIHQIYRLRSCKLNLSREAVSRGKYGVCLKYHIGNCKGPCAELQSEEDYMESIDMARATLRGDMRPTKSRLENAMRAAAAAMRFEEAESYRRRLEQLADYRSRSIIVSSVTQDMDIFSLLIEEAEAYCNFARIIGGALVNSFTAELSLGVDEEPKQVLSSAIGQICGRLSIKLADTVVVPFRPEEALFPGIRFIVPRRGDRLELLRFGEKNIRFYRLEKMKNLEIKDPARHTDRVLETLRKALHMAVPPRHIECFDNSNLHGTNAVAACVVFRDGKPAKREYRHFNIRSVEGIDDFASMREVVGRRYRRMLDEGAALPDLIVVDGGKGQLSSACAVLKELGIDDRVKLVGLAKRIEEVFFPGDPEPYYLERGGEALRVMMHIRDEAHRFGITHHRNKRSKAFIEGAKRGRATAKAAGKSSESAPGNRVKSTK